MENEKDWGLILLTYKNKALLVYEYESSIDEEKHEWTFFKAMKKGKGSLKEALIKVVYKEAGVKLGNIKYLSDNFYHAELSDKDVNSIKREENCNCLFFYTSRD